jgi:hypothetical protein
MGQTADAKDTSTMTTMLLQQKYEQAFILFPLRSSMKNITTDVCKSDLKPGISRIHVRYITVKQTPAVIYALLPSLYGVINITDCMILRITS